VPCALQGRSNRRDPGRVVRSRRHACPADFGGGPACDGDGERRSRGVIVLPKRVVWVEWGSAGMIRCSLLSRKKEVIARTALWRGATIGELPASSALPWWTDTQQPVQELWG
jgi:hypothetical protein